MFKFKTDEVLKQFSKKTGMFITDRQKRVLEPVTPKKPNKKPKILEKSPPPLKKPIAATVYPEVDFLGFLQCERNGLVEQAAQAKDFEDRITTISEQLQCSKLSIKERNDLKSQRNTLITNLGKITSPQITAFDSSITPLLRMYYRKQATPERLIALYKETFQQHANAPLLQLMGPDICHRCGSEYKESPEECLLVCTTCAEAVQFMDASASSVAYGDEVEYMSFSYKRMNHLNEWLNHFQARESTRIPETCIESIMARLRDNGCTEPTFADVKLCMKSLKLRGYYDNCMQAWCRITGKEPVRLSPECEERIRLMFMCIQKPFEKHCPPNRTNFLNYTFVICCFCDMLGYTELLPYFSLLKGEDKLEHQIDIFAAVLKEVGWDYDFTMILEKAAEDKELVN